MIDEVNEDVPDESGDPGVPTDLMELHINLEDSGITTEELKEVFGVEAGDES